MMASRVGNYCSQLYRGQVLIIDNKEGSDIESSLKIAYSVVTVMQSLDWRGKISHETAYDFTGSPKGIKPDLPTANRSHIYNLEDVNEGTLVCTGIASGSERIVFMHSSLTERDRGRCPCPFPSKWVCPGWRTWKYLCEIRIRDTRQEEHG